MKYGYQPTLTAREQRRASERKRTREERRKQVEAYWAMSPEERAEQIALSEQLRNIQKNGITLDDLRNAEREGQRDGYQAGKTDTLHICYAAIAMAAHEEYGFDRDKVIAFLRAVDERIINALSSEEAIQDAFDSVGIQITFNSPFTDERVTEVE